MKFNFKNLIPTTKKMRVRFAPSPTGPLHIGGARTALFNYLFAKKNNSDFILRIEDTDKERSELKWVQEIIDGLKWLGIEWNEGPDIDGKFGPYKQSQRIEIYEKYLKKLLDKKEAYHCFCTPDELEAKRQDQLARGLAPKYDGTCRNLSEEIINKNAKEGRPSVIRFKIPNKKVKFEDLIRETVEFDAGLLGDIVIAKDLQTPLFHFAVVVDDYLMKISHVIRGEEHLSNTPRQILIQESLRFKTPIYAHLPLMLNPDKSKLSKRQGDVALEDYRKKGYLSEAIVNFMALLGWNPGTSSGHQPGQTEREIFSLTQLVKEFSIKRVQKSGAVFNIQKLDNINSYYIKEMPNSELVKLCLPYLIESKLVNPASARGSGEAKEKIDMKYLEKVIELHKTRMKTLGDIVTLADFLLCDKLNYEKNLLKWKEMANKDIKESLVISENVLSGAEKWTQKYLEEILMPESEKFNLKKGYPQKNRGYLLWPLRVALSGRDSSAGPLEIAEVLGKEKTLQRIRDGIDKLNK